MKINKKNIAKLQEWVANPTNDLKKYLAVMAGLRAHDLMFLMTSDDKVMARIAWVEFGRRRQLADIEINLIQIGGTVELKYETDAIPMAHTVTLDDCV